MPHAVYILKPCSHVKCADLPCSNFHKPLWNLEHEESAHLTGFNRLEHAGSLVPRPKQPQRGSLAVSRAGKEGLRI